MVIKDTNISRSPLHHCLKCGLVGRGDGILVAFSGGADSTALLTLFAKSAEGLGIHIRAAYFNHQLRPEAGLEQRHVERFGKLLGVEVVIGSGDVCALAVELKTGIHAAARQLRYAFLLEAARNWKRQLPEMKRIIIATAHHLDDQAETVLMKLLAGSGISGYAGIRRWRRFDPRDEIYLFRPLLETRRRELESYCTLNGLDFVRDSSNKDPRFPRARIRCYVLPAMERALGSAAFDAILHHAETANLVAEAIDDLTHHAWIDSVRKESADEIAIEYAKYRACHEIVRGNLIQRVCRKLIGAGSRITYERCREIDRYCASDGRGRVELGGGLCASKYKDWLFIYRKQPQDWGFDLDVPGEVDIPGWGRIEAGIVAVDVEVKRQAKGVQVCDLDKITQLPMRVQPLRGGDRITPLGMNSSVKVVEILRAAGVPPHRRVYPAICSGGDIIAIPPFRIADAVKVTATTKRMVKFRVGWRVAPVIDF